jgi:hypothetical protein
MLLTHVLKLKIFKMPKVTNYKYNPKWEKEFLWLKPDPTSKTRAWCQYCKVDLKPKLDILKDHARGKGHTAKMPLSNVNVRSQLPFKPVNIIPVEVKKVELKLTAMAVCHTSFNAMDHICEIVSSEGKGSLFEKIKLRRTKEH